MKPFLLVCLLILIFGSDCLAETLPQRKAGLWATSSITQGKTVTSKYCAGPSDDMYMSKLRKQSSEKAGYKCTSKISKSANSYITEDECVRSDMKTRVKVIYTGDFNSLYKTTVTSEKIFTSGSPSVTQSSELTSNYEGPCPEGHKPGTTVFPDGRVLDINNPPVQPKPAAIKTAVPKAATLKKPK